MAALGLVHIRLCISRIGVAKAVQRKGANQNGRYGHQGSQCNTSGHGPVIMEIVCLLIVDGEYSYQGLTGKRQRALLAVNCVFVETMVDVAIRVQVGLSNLTLRYPEFVMLIIGEPHDVISEQPGQTFTVTNSFKFDRFDAVQSWFRVSRARCQFRGCTSRSILETGASSHIM